MSWSGILRSSSSNTLRRSEALYWSLQSYSQAYFSGSWNRYLLAASIVWENGLFGATTKDTRKRLNKTRVGKTHLEKFWHQKRKLSSWSPSCASAVNITSSRSPEFAGSASIGQISKGPEMGAVPRDLINALNPKNLSDLELIESWRKEITSTDRRRQMQALAKKQELYSHFLSSLQRTPNEDLLEQLLALVHCVPHPHSSVDYNFRIYLLRISGELDMISCCLEEASNQLSKDEFLAVLRAVVDDFISSHTPIPPSFLNIFASTILKYDGTLELLSRRYHEERSILKSIIRHLSTASPTLTSILDDFLRNSPHFGSMLVTTCIDILGQPEDVKPQLVEQLWNRKLELDLASPLDLHRVMTAFYHNCQYEQVLHLYDSYPSLHMHWQFDIVLLTLAKLRNWDRLQTVFESLFRHDDLPDINHYGIVIQALSQLGKVDIVDTLFSSLLAKSINPSIEILHGLMYSRLALGEVHGVEYFFNQITILGLRPNPRSYNILLRSYRDSHEIQKALNLIGQMAELNIPITRYAVTTLISTCTERRDTETGEALFDWALSYGIKPDIIMFNSLIACYMESNCLTKAEKIYEMMKEGSHCRPTVDTLTSMLTGYSRMATKIPNSQQKVLKLEEDMKKYSISPDDRWLSSLMHYNLSIKNFKQVEAIFVDLTKKYRVDTTPYHYSIMMEAYIIQRKLKEAEELYNTMKQQNVIPTFNTQEKYLRLKISDPAAKVRQEAAGYLQDFLQATDIIDLESKQLPRNVIPFSMVKRVSREFMKSGNYESALEFMKPYNEEGYDPKEQFKVSAFMLELYGHAGYWSLIEKTWESFLEQVRRAYVPVKVSDGAEPRYEKRLPTRYRGTFWQAVNSKLNQLQNFGQYSKMLDLISWAEKEGLGVTSKNMNTLVKGLLFDDKFLVKAFEVSEECLAPTTVAKLQAKGSGHTHPLYGLKYKDYNLSMSTFKALVRKFDRLITITAYEGKCSRLKAFILVNEKYPKLMKLFSWREKSRTKRRPRLAAST
ncbi:Pet309p [Sugiyamaella lignohabitans]|uniref:Pet309p n=1 Tax=Sugiyamaella lignohabitans TaxID=796027 RepID=A0A167ESW1_9ASCO|nr:Pet309p [Sugiyamaella lignohabitans]ANB14414.1 Pet309p [Sugiyamaella lignohabitans]